MLLRFIKLISSAAVSSKAHAAIDLVYDQLWENQLGLDGEVSERDVVVEMCTEVSQEKKGGSPLIIFPEYLLVIIASYIDDPISFSMTCKLFWNIIAAVTSFRVFNQCLRVEPERSSLLSLEGSSNRVPAIIRAYGNRELRVKSDLIARNLELALCSPAFRAAFDDQIWRSLRQTRKFRELTERILMESQDDSFTGRQTVSPELEAHRRTLIYILASLPLFPELVKTFFSFYPIQLLNSRTELVFQKLINSISERIALLPKLNGQILELFSFDSRLIENIVKIHLQTGAHDQLWSLLFDIRIPNELQDIGQVFVGGCVDIQTFFILSNQFLNRFDQNMFAILSELELRAPAHIPPLMLALCDKFCGQLKFNEMFRLAVLKSAWEVLEHFENFDFSYDKNDSDFLAYLIERDYNYATMLIDRIPLIASHKAFLLNAKFQSRHFSTFNKLKDVRIELKRTITCPEITRAHIKFIQEFQPALFQLLSEDSAERISNYFTLKLKGHERKRYKEHPSFTIALTVIDACFESIFFIKYQNRDVDPEIILKSILIDFKMMRDDCEEYFEIAHGLPSFSKALLIVNTKPDEEVLYTPEAALNQSISEFELLSRTFALSRVIHDGSAINYRLVLTWFEAFNLNLAGIIIPVPELKSLIKGAAFNTFRTAEDKKLVFNLDEKIFRDEPFSMTYRYALIIIVTQCRGNRSAVAKRIKSLFGVDSDNGPISSNFTNLLSEACSFYQLHIDFFNSFKFVATNTRAERFLLDFIKHFIIAAELVGANIDNIIKQFFKFIQLDPVEEILLKDHLIYFVLLASFKRS